MSSLPNCEDEVALDHVGHLLSLPLEHHLVTITHAALNFNCQSLLIVDDLAALAVRAVLCSHVPSAAAPVASRLHLHLHSEADLHHLDDDLVAIASGADLGLAILGPCASALGTIHVPCYGHVPAGA